jgi:hypothetical protein
MTNGFDMDNPTGLHDDLDERIYHAHPTSLSVSGAKTILKAPALYQWERAHPVFKSVFDFGSAAHKMVLGVGPELVVHKSEAKSPKATNAWRDEQIECRARGAILLLPEEHDRVAAMAQALRKHGMAARLLSNGTPEVSAFCTDPDTGIMRRSRFDWNEPTGILADYKTAVSAEPNAFAKAAAQYGYHQQSGWYQDIAVDLGIDVRGFVLIVQEKDPPFLVSVIQLDEEAEAVGRALNRCALRIYAECTESGEWPGYRAEDEITSVSLPAWALRDEQAA